MLVRPARAVNGSLRLPGDKSISHRYAMLAAIAHGPSHFENFPTGADCSSTLDCLRELGVGIKRGDSPSVVEIQGQGSQLGAPSRPLPCGNSGLTMRMLAGILAGQNFSSELTGDESLSRRPMGRVIRPLTEMGAQIDASEGGRAPLRIEGSKLHGISYRMPVASAQVKSAVLFAGLLADGSTTVTEPVQTRDHSELALRAFGAEMDCASGECRIEGGQELHGLNAVVPGDISSAAFFLCAAAIFPGSNLILDHVLLNPTRTAILDFLVSMGVKISILNLEEENGELHGALQIQGGGLKGGRISGAMASALIDELPVIAGIAPYTEDGIEVRDATELELKESDRIQSTGEALRAFGANVQVLKNGWNIPGQQKLHGAVIDSHGDHRIAMAAAITALRATGESTIHGDNAVEISYPAFFADLQSLVER